MIQFTAKALTLLLAACLMESAGASAAEETAIGRQVEDFALPDFHGQTHALADYRERIVVLAFLGTECPLAKSYAGKLQALANEFADRQVAFLGIDANLQDSLTEMATFARVHGLTFPLLKDNNHVIADRLGAIRTPEVFVLDRQHVIRYWGRIDDQFGFRAGGNYVKPQQTQNNLADAIHSVLKDTSVPVPVTKADGCLIGRVAKAAPHGAITYSRQIVRIFQNRCQSCHRPDEIAPFSMMSYDEVIGWGAMIREVVSEGRMPPWFADPKYGHFSNDARLTVEEKEQICAWVDNGCPEGDPKDLPPEHEYSPTGKWASPTRSST